MTQLSRWLTQFQDVLNDRQEIRRRATIPATRVVDLGELPEEIARNKLKAALESMHYVSEQELEILDTLVQTAYSYALAAYPDDRTFIGHVQQDFVELGSFEPTFLSGLAGTGKSALFDALQRVLRDGPAFSLSDEFQGKFELEPTARLLVKSRASVSEILEPFQRSPSNNQPPSSLAAVSKAKKRPGFRLHEGLRLAQKRCYRRGNTLSLLDELQFATQSQSANTRAAQMVMTLSYLPQPLVYAMNFSLWHRLLGRPQEERDRLLARPIVLLPDAPNSEDVLAVLREYDVITGEFRGFSFTDEAEELFKMTANVKRKLRQIVTLGYTRYRGSGRPKMTIDDLTAAYKSLQFCAMRDDVEAIFMQATMGKPLPKKLGLWCPGGVSLNVVPSTVREVRQAREAEAAAELLAQSMTKPEREKLATSEARKSPSTKSTEPSGKVIKMPRRKTLDASALLRNTIAHRDQGKAKMENPST